MTSKQHDTIPDTPYTSLENIQKALPQPNKTHGWNTSGLGLRIGADAASAATASALVAPIICVIDRYVQLVINKEKKVWLIRFLKVDRLQSCNQQTALKMSCRSRETSDIKATPFPDIETISIDLLPVLLNIHDSKLGGHNHIYSQILPCRQSHALNPEIPRYLSSQHDHVCLQRQPIRKDVLRHRSINKRTSSRHSKALIRSVRRKRLLHHLRFLQSTSDSESGIEETP